MLYCTLFHLRLCSESIKLTTIFVQGIQNKEDYRLLTIVIANCRVSPPEDHKKYETLLVIDVTMFTDLYGILEPLLKPQITNRLTINTADCAILLQYSSKDVVDRIMRVRGVGFKDKSDFDKRMSDEGGSIEDEKRILDDCDF